MHRIYSEYCPYSPQSVCSNYFVIVLWNYTENGFILALLLRATEYVIYRFQENDRKVRCPV